MCTVVLLVRPGHAWPLILGANRDELLERPWDPPARHWPDRPNLVAGRDRLGGGTWMGLNDDGVVAAVLNRPGSLGPAAGKHSRGELPLFALAHPTAAASAAAITALDAGLWRGFNLVVADRGGAVFVRGLGHGHPEARRLAPGIHMVTAHDPDDHEQPARGAAPGAVPLGRATGPGGGHDPGLARLAGHPGGQRRRARRADQRGAAGRLRHGLLVLARLPRAGHPVWLFAAGPPHEVPFSPVE